MGQTIWPYLFCMYHPILALSSINTDYYIAENRTRNRGRHHKCESCKRGIDAILIIYHPSIHSLYNNASQLLDKRSATTSDRPPTYAGDVVTGGFNMGIGRYADNWRASRKACQAILTAQANTNVHLPIQKAEATQLLYDIVKTPEVRRSASSSAIFFLFTCIWLFSSISSTTFAATVTLQFSR